MHGTGLAGWSPIGAEALAPVGLPSWKRERAIIVALNTVLCRE